MSTESHRRRAGKTRMRGKLASLAIGDKLRLLEKMRGEVLKPETAKEDQPHESAKPEPKQIGSLLLRAIQQTVERGDRTTDFVSSNNAKRLASEVEHLFADREDGLEALKALFPEGVTADVAFFNRLADLEMRLGWNETSHRATGLLLLLAVRELPVESAEALLRELPRVGGPNFFQALDTLAVLLAEFELRPEFAAEWFPNLVRRIGNDFASGGFWKALGIYCERQAQNALEVLRCLATPQTEEQISVAAYILGVLRTLDLSGQTSAQFKTLETRFLDSGTVAARSIYYRSWIQTAFRGKIRITDLQSITSRMCAGTSEENEQVFWIVSRVLLSPSILKDCFNFGLEWLRARASGTLGASAKYPLVDLAAQLPVIHQKEAAELILSVQPILAEHKGMWQRIEHFMVPLLQRDLNAFNEFFVKLARSNPTNLLKALNTAREFEWLLSEMRGRDVSAAVGQLVFDGTTACRKLGLFFFDDLDLTTLPKGLLDGLDERRLALAFYESQRTSLHAVANARFLVILIPCIARADSATQDEFHDELVLQLKNYPGGCRDEFQRRAKDFSILQKTITQVDAYFQQLKQARESGIAAMEVTGSRQAARLSGRRFAQAVSKGAEEMSVFMNMFKKVRLLYGKQWSTFHDGALSESSGLQTIHSEVEMPRMEFIDPEGMNLRRYQAAAKIRELSEASSREEANS
jgi:hypothetical protein